MVCPGSTQGCNYAHAFPICEAYHVSNDKFSIATVDHGVDATVKIWTACRSSPHRVSDRLMISGCEKNVDFSDSLSAGSLSEKGGLQLH